MKTVEQFISQLDNIAHSNGNLKNKDIVNAIIGFEKEIRQDQKEKCIESISKLTPITLFNDEHYCKPSNVIRSIRSSD